MGGVLHSRQAGGGSDDLGCLATTVRCLPWQDSKQAPAVQLESLAATTVAASPAPHRLPWRSEAPSVFSPNPCVLSLGRGGLAAVAATERHRAVRTAGRWHRPS